MTKNEVFFNLVSNGLARETFTSIDFEFVIDISSIREIVVANPKRWPVTRVLLNPQVVDFVSSKREIDADRMKTLTRAQLEDFGFVATFPDGKDGVCPIDGHHRMMRRYEIGLPFMDVYLIPWMDLPQADPNRPTVSWGNKQVNRETGDWDD